MYSKQINYNALKDLFVESGGGIVAEASDSIDS